MVLSTPLQSLSECFVRRNKMFSKDYNYFMDCVQRALQLPIRSRCAELTLRLDRASLQELHNCFPILLDSIFGTQGTPCWGLRAITERDGEDYRQLNHFLSPRGPLFNLIYRLLKDPNIKYEFPLSFLPVKIKQLLEAPSGHPFYSELVNTNPQTKQCRSLLLNPFDYYFFHFAYHLINPWQQRAGSAVTSWNTVYYCLCCDYILHFLPIDPAAKIHPEIYYNGKNPLQRTSPQSSAHQGSPRTPGGAYSNLREDPAGINLRSHHPRNEIWRSETVLTVFTDIWLYNDSVVSQPATTTDINYAFSSSAMRLYYNELPTGEYMRIVRVLLKQLHAFSDSAKCDDTYLCELKKISIPMIQGKFYVFIRNLIYKWPLDGSFRLVLELWLTYIQPWRYPASNLIKRLVKQDGNPDAEDITLGANQLQMSPTIEHLPFIANNLLCYVAIFEQLLPRFMRVDLVSPKMSLMLYRISKVFDQPNLPSLLREVEQCLENGQSSSPKHKNYAGWGNHITLPTYPAPFSGRLGNISLRNSPMGPSDHKWASITRQKIFELEGPNFTYRPLFANPPAHEVYELLVQIKKSIGYAQNLIANKEQEEKVLYSGFWGSIKYFLQSPVSTDDFTLDDRRKVPVYLEVAFNNLREMFAINEEIIVDEVEPVPTSNGNEFEMSGDFKFLTPEKVRQRLKTIRYDGDPDLEPIKSTECTFMVRALYQLATKVNENFGPTFYQLYHNPTYWGRFARQILMAPVTVHNYDKTALGSPRVSVHLPPRISFRCCASFKFIRYFILGALIAWLIFGYRFDAYLFTITSSYLLYKMLKAIPKNSPNSTRHGYPTQGFGNISFSDSF
ncbi:sphingomyelin phosphodiesterase 4 isoform X1 [Dendroctonus ponderosae]|uniref:sphingomyelin phosphodiesterase 4 isoform X1 n=1 Tax=Dendroctonus ponderosae TaxID=77166 RepID=UPI002034F368|nr:sphingomyelin phosphodiesterase 4 isoform X1 [Dendroctonus ponderosae]